MPNRLGIWTSGHFGKYFGKYLGMGVNLTGQHPLIKDCSVWIQTSVRWGDMDAYGHLNNTAYFRLFEDARIHYFERMKLGADENLTHLGVVVATISAKFKMPLVYPETLQVGCKIANVDENRITMLYKIVALEKGRVACTGDSLLVAVDLRTMEKVTLDERFIQRINEIEQNDIN